MRSKDRLKFAVTFVAVYWMIFAGISNTNSEEVPKVAREHQRSEKNLESNATGREIIVYYFHGTYRCPSCLQIEDWSFDAIRERSASALERGTITWKTINIDEPENRRLAEAYQLSNQALIIAEITGKKRKRYKNLEKVCKYLLDDKTFYDYVAREIDRFLAGT